MSKYEQFVNQYPVSKTLKFRLIPEGKTEEYFVGRNFLESDRVRAEEYKVVKKIIDRYHKKFIEGVLVRTVLPGLAEYAELYYQTKRTDEESERFAVLAADMAKHISVAFKNQPEFKLLFGQEMIKDLLPTIATAEEMPMVENFRTFTTYFNNFFLVREEMYDCQGRACEIATRIVRDNLPRYLDNCRAGKRILEAISADAKEELAKFCAEDLQIDLNSLFDPVCFNSYLAQTGIDRYNQALGGYATADGIKIKGINEHVNEHNMISDTKLPKLVPLYKMLLSDRTTMSHVPESFDSDDSVLTAIADFWRAGESTAVRLANMIKAAVSGDADRDHVYWKKSASLRDLSKWVLGDATALQSALTKTCGGGKDKKSYSIAELNIAIAAARQDTTDDLASAVTKRINEAMNELKAAAQVALPMLATPYAEKKSLKINEPYIRAIKTFLDAALELLHLAKPLAGTGLEADKDERFYGDFTPLLDAFDEVVPLYNMVRNYITAKPYSTSKFKLNFEKPGFLNGWAQSFESKGAQFVRRNNKYYVIICNEKITAEDLDRLLSDEAADGAELLAYHYQKPDMKNIPKLFIWSKRGTKLSPNVELLNLPVHDILEIYEKGMFLREYAKVDPVKQREALTKMIDYFKLGLSRHPSYSEFTFKWRDSADYVNIAEFYRDCTLSCYRITNEPIDWAFLQTLVEEGKIYLFRLHNADFSDAAHGTEKLHTQYFKMLFDDRNLVQPCFQLNGGAEMFYRPASISKSDEIVHLAGRPIKSKNPLNTRSSRTFEYNITKDRRYTRAQYELHLALTANFSYSGSKFLNAKVRDAICAEDDTYVVGIDRGESNLLYVCVVDGRGNIVEQRSLDTIVSEHNGTTKVTNYATLLAERSAARHQQRQDWKTIDQIKHLKEGYISQAVSEICRLAVKYDAVIAMEDLSGNFKRNRTKIEKAVYQKLEEMLIRKLNLLADKRKNPEKIGGVLNAYQITEPFTSFAKMGRQNGFLMFMSAAYTSNIDPTTGFVDLLRPKYESVAKAKEFFGKFDRIYFDRTLGLFAFDTDYDKFEAAEYCPRRNWTIHTYGTRIRWTKTTGDHAVSDKINLTDDMKALFARYGIRLDEDNLVPQILKQTDAAFFRELTALLALTLQMQCIDAGRGEDYVISPVRNDHGEFFFSAAATQEMPQTTAANGAYNIARKAQWALANMRASEGGKYRLTPSNAEWLTLAQSC